MQNYKKKYYTNLIKKYFLSIMFMYWEKPGWWPIWYSVKDAEKAARLEAIKKDREKQDENKKVKKAKLETKWKIQEVL